MKFLLSKAWKKAWKKTDEEEDFAEKAVDSLYKKLKVKPGAIEELEKALFYPDIPTKCVTITRSLDGRLQVSHRKGLPHVIYCRIFRWPDLQSHHELKPIDTCKYAYSSKNSTKSEVCINPYHYERIEVPILPPVLVPKHVEFPLGHSVIHNTVYSEKENMNSRPDCSLNSASSSIENFRSNINYNYYNYYQNSTLNTSTAYSNSSFSSTNSPRNEITMYEESSTDNYSNLSHPYRNTVPYSNYYFNQTATQRESWCSIVYYELNMRISETFHSYTNDVFIDGYTNPCGDFDQRFCLGAYSNINRNSTIENCRKHIGRGVHIYNDNGDVFVECLSESPVFIQSRSVNYDQSFHPNTVCKLLSGYSLRVFQSKVFAKLLQESVNTGYDAVYDLSNMCVIKISFVKGWGSDYYRQDISSCPCWIEIRLNTQFKWLDSVLKEMGPSNNAITSVS